MAELRRKTLCAHYKKVDGQVKYARWPNERRGDFPIYKPINKNLKKYLYVTFAHLASGGCSTKSAIIEAGESIVTNRGF